jgi:hypothetical protein
MEINCENDTCQFNINENCMKKKILISKGHDNDDSVVVCMDYQEKEID